MRIVVTGASGNLGSAALRELTTDGAHEVLALARRAPEQPPGAEFASVRWRAADVSDDDLAPHFEGADVVVHLAWKFQPTHRPATTWATNVDGTRRVLEAAVRAGVPTVVCASSVAAYSPAVDDTPVDEGWGTDGTSSAAYCREKAYVERLLDAFEAGNPQVRLVRIRPAFVFQRSAASEQRRIFGGPLVRPMMLDRRRLPVVPLPAGLRFQAVHAGDVARGLRAAVERPVSGAFNLAGQGVLDREELAGVLDARVVELPGALAVRGLDLAWRAHAAQVPGSLLQALLRLPLMSNDRAEAELGWTPEHSGADAVRAFLSGAPQRAGSSLPPLHR